MSNLAQMQGLSLSMEGLVIEGSREFMRLFHRATLEPFGKSPGTPIDTKEAVSGGRVGLNGPPSTAPSGGSYQPAPVAHVSAATAGMKPGDSLHWRNAVKHAVILDDGRRHSEKAGRMLGSEQAPEGFTKQARETACDELAKWRYTG